MRNKPFAPSATLALLIISAALAGCATPEPARAPASPPIPVYVPTAPTAQTSEAPAPVLAPAVEPKPAAVVPAPPTPAQARLAEGIALYESGDFNGAIKKLTTSPELAPKVIEPELRTATLKYSAFSYCVTNRRTLCRRQFDALLANDPGFELTPSEAGHPIWGPVFVQAKRALAAKRN